MLRLVMAPGEVDEGGGERMREGRSEGRETRWTCEVRVPRRSRGECDERCREVMVSLHERRRKYVGVVDDCQLRAPPRGTTSRG